MHVFEAKIVRLEGFGGPNSDMAWGGEEKVRKLTIKDKMIND
jgi:hypothetical protein